MAHVLRTLHNLLNGAFGVYFAVLSCAAAFGSARSVAAICLALGTCLISHSRVLVAGDSHKVTVVRLVPALGVVAISVVSGAIVKYEHERGVNDFFTSCRTMLLGGEWLVPAGSHRHQTAHVFFAMGLLTVASLAWHLASSGAISTRHDAIRLYVRLLVGFAMTVGLLCGGAIPLLGYGFSWDVPLQHLGLALLASSGAFPDLLLHLGSWLPNQEVMQLHGRFSLLPSKVLRRPVPGRDWHVLTIGADPEREVQVYSEWEEQVPWPRELVLAYCADFAMVPVRQDGLKYICGASRLNSAWQMKRYVPGLTLVGANPVFGIKSLTDRTHSFPILNQSLEIWEELSRPPEVNIFCAPPHCDLLRRSDRRLGIVEEDRFPGQHLGFHFQHAVVPFYTSVVGSRTGTYIYPPTSYNVAYAEELVVPSPPSSRPYVILCSRQLQRHNRLPQEKFDDLQRRLNATLASAGSSLELRIFAKPSGNTEYANCVEDTNLEVDAALFRGASAVIGWHGGCFVNLIHCKAGTVVVEGHYVNATGRLQHTSMSYANNHKYFVYTPTNAPIPQWSYIDDRGLTWFDVSEFLSYVVSVLRAAGLIE